MDPDTALAEMENAGASLEHRAEHAAALLAWLDRGGFLPASIHSAAELARVTARARQLVELEQRAARVRAGLAPEYTDRPEYRDDLTPHE